MTEAELAELLGHCPTLYHMAEAGSWPSIQANGLLSTTALLDLYAVRGPERERVESQRRPEIISLERHELGRAFIRDQKPMTDGGLIRCLPPEMQPRDWYRCLNSKVFFWLTKQRLDKLLNAYKNRDHDVLEVDSKKLVENYHDKVWLCPINSGSTKPFPSHRDLNTFSRITEYPYSMWKAKKRKRGERVVEFTIDYAIPDIIDYVKRVERRNSNGLVEVLFLKTIY